MIKLKDIVNEISNTTTNVWRTSPEVPDEVVEILHKLTAHVMKLYPEIHSGNFIQLSKLKQDPGGWVVSNPQDREVFMIFVPSKNEWLAPDNIDGKIKLTPLSPNGMDIWIHNWIL